MIPSLIAFISLEISLLSGSWNSKLCGPSSVEPQVWFVPDDHAWGLGSYIKAEYLDVLLSIAANWLPHSPTNSSTMFALSTLLLTAASIFGLTAAQTFQRLGGCPSRSSGPQATPPLLTSNPSPGLRAAPGPNGLSCGSILWYTSWGISRVNFGQEGLANGWQIHAPVNGSEAKGGVPDPNFSFTIAKANGASQSAVIYFKMAGPSLERWNFTWYEDLFAQDAHAPSVVRVTSKIYRHVALYEPGEYVATLNYYNGTKLLPTGWFDHCNSRSEPRMWSCSLVRKKACTKSISIR
jgi:hypothetical protein